MKDILNQIIYTTEKCTGCNRCISACAIEGANQAIIINGENKVNINGELCIHCGACIDACKHGARNFYDDTDRFFNDLDNGEKISILVAPSFIANYPNEYKKILGYLKNKGVNKIVSVSFGADITTWGYLKYITENNFIGGISQPCSAIVDYIEKYEPELIDKLIPIHSPMMCTAIYLKKYMRVNDKLAFISPCIAKKIEISKEGNKGYIEYNVTFSRLMEKIKNINIDSYSDIDDMEYGLGSIYPMPGGLKENVEHFLGKDIAIKQVEGKKHAYDYLNRYNDRVKSGKELPFMIDILNCDKGCLGGTAIEGDKQKDDSVFFEIQKLKRKDYAINVKKKKKSPWSKESSCKDRLKAFNSLFKELNINDFICNYDKTKVIKGEEPSKEMLDLALLDMKKDTEQKRNINCAACGYDSCLDMAKAITKGFNTKENCIHYLKYSLEMEKDKIDKFNEELQEKQKRKEELYSQILNQFIQINESMKNLNNGNEQAVNDVMNIVKTVDTVVEYVESLKKSLLEVSDAVKGYNKINESVIDISTETNLLSLNASIEAARSGDAGKGFSVIAEKVGELAQTTKETVESGNNQLKIINPAIETLYLNIENVLKGIELLDKKIEDISGSSEEINANSESVKELVDNILIEMKGIID